MNARARGTAFVALIIAVFGLSALAGRAIDPDADAGEPAHRAASPGDHQAAPAATHGPLRLVAGATTLTAGAPHRLTFRIVDENAATLRAFETEQGRRMHLIVVRRDLRRFQHLHPTQDARGAWSIRLKLPDAGVYHFFADFQTAGVRRTLGADLFVAGRFKPLALPAPGTAARVDGYDVTLQVRRATGRLSFDVSRDGATVADLQPYLGARGHLVMLRAGDLAYEHVHPLSKTALAFETGHAEPGSYRLFLQFRHDDAIHTAAFTRVVSR